MGNPDHVFHLIVSREKRLFVFLQVALVAGWQAFERSEEAEERGRDASSLPPQKFPRVGILLLRHQAAARGIFIGQNDVGKLMRGEKHEVLRKARKMRGDARQRKKIFERKVAVTDGVEAVRRDAREA